MLIFPKLFRSKGGSMRKPGPEEQCRNLVFRTRFRPLGTIAPTRCGAILDNCSLICFAVVTTHGYLGRYRRVVATIISFSVDSKHPRWGKPTCAHGQNASRGFVCC